MHDIGTPDVACAARTSTLYAAIFRAHGARYCIEAQVHECTNLLWPDLEDLFERDKQLSQIAAA